MICYKLVKICSIHDVLGMTKSMHANNNIYIYFNCEKKFIKKRYTISCCGQIDFQYLTGKFYEKIKMYSAYNIINVFIFDNDFTVSCGEKYIKLNDMISCWRDFEHQKKINIYHMYSV